MSNVLINKWSPVLRYVEKDGRTVPEENWLKCAKALEKIEQKYLRGEFGKETPLKEWKNSPYPPLKMHLISEIIKCASKYQK